MKKRGQITVFLIIGVIIILSGLLIFYLMQSDESIEEIVTPTVPVETTPVYNLVEQCMHDLTSKALDLVMGQGGYIYQDSLFAHPIYSTEGNSIELFPGSSVLIPYWYFMESQNECTSGCVFASKRKPLCKDSNIFCGYKGDNSIENEIEIYLKNELNSCLNNFVAIESTGIKINPQLDPEFEVTIRSDSLLVELEYPLEIIVNDQITELFEYRIVKPSSIYELYEIATKITNYQQNDCLLEKNMINLILLYSGTNSVLPPFSYSSYKSNYWLKSNVKDYLDYINYAYTPLIKLFNTSTQAFSNSYQEGTFAYGINTMFVYYPFEKFYNFIPSFSFSPFKETYFDISPSKGELIIPRKEGFQSNPIMQLLGEGFIPIEVDYYYSYSFPTIVELRKFGPDYSFSNLETFRFALEGNIRANRCYKSEGQIFSQISEQSLLCNPLFFMEDEIKFELLDDYTNEPIENVEIEYHAGTICPLGNSNQSGEINLNLPSAIGGIIKFSKQGYLDKIISKEDLQQTNTIKLMPLFEKNIDILMINNTLLNNLDSVQNFNNYRRENANQLKENMSLLIQLERIKQNEFDPDFSRTLFLEFDDLDQTIELTKGLYELNMLLILNEEIILPEEKNKMCINTDLISLRGCRKVPVNENCYRPSYCDPWPTNPESDERCFKESDCYIDGFTCSEGCDIDEDIIYDQQNLSSIMIGGLIINETNSLWNVNDYNLLNNSQKIEFYVYDQGVPKRTSLMIESLDQYMIYSMSYRDRFRPYFN
jgi:hypothetical protein